MPIGGVPAAWRDQIDGWRRWLISAGRPRSTLDLRIYQIRRIAHGVGGSPLTVTVDDLVAWFAAQTWGAETRRSYRAAATTFGDYLVATGGRADNPARLLPGIRPVEGRPRPTPESVLVAALASADDRVRLMLLLAARLGMRRGEISRARVDDLVEGVWGWSLTVHGKGAKVRVVPVTDELARVIRRHAGGAHGWLFPSGNGGHLSAAYVGRLVSAELPPEWTCHTLRHRFATRAYAHQRDLLAVQQLLGHASPVTTRRYVEVPDDALRAAMGAAA